MVDSYWANENCRPSVYRWDPSGRLDLVVTEEQIPDPNGILFSPDYKKLYVISTGKGPGDTGPSAKAKFRSSTLARTTSSRIKSCSPIAWSTA
jgi:hypothetical protein